MPLVLANVKQCFFHPVKSESDQQYTVVYASTELVNVTEQGIICLLYQRVHIIIISLLITSLIVSENDGLYSIVTMSCDMARTVYPHSCSREIGIAVGATVCPIIIVAVTIIVALCCWR